MVVMKGDNIMEDRVYDSRHRLIGIIKKERENKYIFYNARMEQMGYYDERRDETYDSYDHFVGQGNLLSDLPYISHKLRFPLPSMEQVSFTTYQIKRAGCDSQRRTTSAQYWDNGRCEICTKSGQPTCHVQGLPGMCKTCYRMFEIYSRTDTFDLEHTSKYRPITVQQIRKAVETAKAPFIAAEKAADAAAKAAFVQIPLEMLRSAAENKPNTSTTGNTTAAKISPAAQASVRKTTSNSSKGKKKKHLRWYHWILIFIVGYYGFQILIVVVYWILMR